MFNRGDKVMVSNGEPEPPAHHTKKRRMWGLYNYTGWVHRVEPDGSIAVDQSGQGMFCMVVRPWELSVTKIEGADYESRVQAYEAQGMTRGDAQAIVGAEDLQQ